MLNSTGNGFCTFDIIRHGRRGNSLATGQELLSAGVALLTQCVGSRNGQAGIATNIGTNFSCLQKSPQTEELPFFAAFSTVPRS